MGYKIGIDIGGSHFACVLLDDTKNIIAKEAVDIEFACADVGAGVEGDPVQKIAQLIKLCINKANIDANKIDFIGIGIPGTYENTKIKYLANIGIKDFEIGEKLKSKYAEIGIEETTPILLENDANCAAIGEMVAGSLKGVKNGINIVFGTGVGAGIIIDGKLYKGAHGGSGEIGHMVIDKNSKVQCNCGMYGCIETLCSVKRLKANISSRLGYRVHGTELLKVLNDEKVKGIYEEYKNNLVRSLICIVNILDPEIISIGGSLAYFIGQDLEEINTRVNNECFYKENGKGPYKIVKSELENDAGLIGAASLGNIKY